MLRMNTGWMLLTVLAIGAAASAADTSHSTLCKDGTTTQAIGRGACSKHGGVASSESSKAGTGTMATPGSSSAAASSSPAGAPAATPPPATVAPPGTATRSTAPQTVQSGGGGSGANAPKAATAQCKDGSYSTAKSHRGACSRHGGVTQWLDASPK